MGTQSSVIAAQERGISSETDAKGASTASYAASEADTVPSSGEGLLLSGEDITVAVLDAVREDVGQSVLRVQRKVIAALDEIQRTAKTARSGSIGSDPILIPDPDDGRGRDEEGALDGAAGGAEGPSRDGEAKLTAGSDSYSGLPECAFVGIDTSLAPAPDAPSIGSIFESLGVGSIFGAGSVAASSLVTWLLRSLPAEVKTTGYCGLMLPPLEDTSLADWTAGKKMKSSCAPQLHSLLLCSSVCGIGLDTVPVPASATTGAIARVLMDVGALSARLGGKPLSCRLFPVPGTTEPGEPASFPGNPYLCDGAVLPLV